LCCWSAADTAATFGNPAAMNAASVGAYIVKFAVGSDKVAANPDLTTAATKMLVLAFEYTTTRYSADAILAPVASITYQSHEQFRYLLKHLLLQS
jgi:hypothetical protein